MCLLSLVRPVDEALATEIREFRSPTDNETRMFYEIVIAPGYTPEGLQKLKGKSKTLRILEAPLRPPSGRSLRQVAGECAYSNFCVSSAAAAALPSVGCCALLICGLGHLIAEIISIAASCCLNT